MKPRILAKPHRYAHELNCDHVTGSQLLTTIKGLLPYLQDNNSELLVSLVTDSQVVDTQLLLNQSSALVAIPGRSTLMAQTMKIFSGPTSHLLGLIESQSPDFQARRVLHNIRGQLLYSHQIMYKDFDDLQFT